MTDTFIAKLNTKKSLTSDCLPEICLLTNARRTATIVAKSVCDIYILHADDFRRVVDEYPEMRQLMESVATRRLSRMGKPVDLTTYESKDYEASKLQSSINGSVLCGSRSSLIQMPETPVHPHIVITSASSSNEDLTSDYLIT